MQVCFSYFVIFCVILKCTCMFCFISLFPAELRCSGPDWYEFGEFCYKPFADKKTWYAAQDTCRSMGAELVSILSMTEQSWLESYLYMGMDLQESRFRKD